ncbi:hypothetical protein EHJ10_04470 [Cronobacter dublinensis]|nr:hypothetical protein [Cronobacter dublinensis]
MSITSSVANGAVIVTESTRLEYRAAAKARKKAEKRAACGNVARGWPRAPAEGFRNGGRCFSSSLFYCR